MLKPHKSRKIFFFFEVAPMVKSRKILSPPIILWLIIVQFPIQGYRTRGIWGRRVVLDHLRVPTTSNRTKNPSWTWFFLLKIRWNPPEIMKNLSFLNIKYQYNNLRGLRVPVQTILPLWSILWIPCKVPPDGHGLQGGLSSSRFDRLD